MKTISSTLPPKSMNATPQSECGQSSPLAWASSNCLRQPGQDRLISLFNQPSPSTASRRRQASASKAWSSVGRNSNQPAPNFWRRSSTGASGSLFLSLSQYALSGDVPNLTSAAREPGWAEGEVSDPLNRLLIEAGFLLPTATDTESGSSELSNP